jgi:hypothetical protein
MVWSANIRYKNGLLGLLFWQIEFIFNAITSVYVCSTQKQQILVQLGLPNFLLMFMI